MDFGTLLHVAKKNSEGSKSEGKYYSTKFAPPKKVSKEKKLSDNIQKFLKQREQEELERQRREKEKLNNLLAMRDEKSKNKIRKMLKVTKSANKSVLSDVDKGHTAVTMQGPEQPDQDDYGYVSTEANAFYQKYMEKVKDVKEDKGFAPSRPQSLKDLPGTKERVKAAITKEHEEMKLPPRLRTGGSATTSSSATSSSSGKDSKGANIARAYSTSSKPLYDAEAERRDEERKKREEEQKKAKNRKPPPPPMDFQALLKLAEKKQHEPIEIVPEVKKRKEPERLLTSKEKKEIEERQRAKEERENRDRMRNSVMADEKTNKERREPNGRITKLSQTSKLQSAVTATTTTTSATRNPNSAKPSGSAITSSTAAAAAAASNVVRKPHTPVSASSTNSVRPSSSGGGGGGGGAGGGGRSGPSKQSMGTSSNSATPTKPISSTSMSAKAANASVASAASSNKMQISSSKNPYTGPTREFPPRDMKSIKPRQFPPPDVQKTRQFPPLDVRRGGESCKKPQHQASKRRILDDDDEDEYDSEMDDFIDDGEDEDDYSSHIKAIFGYDKSRYRDIDEDDSAMESNFAQVQREEYLSKKIGIQEDLEDMKLEAMEKKRKMMLKKRKLH